MAVPFSPAVVVSAHMCWFIIYYTLKRSLSPSWYTGKQEVTFQNVPEHANLESLEITFLALDAPAIESNLTVNSFNLLAFLFIVRHREG